MGFKKTMRTTANETALLIDVLGRDGEPTGRSVFVYIDFLTTVDAQYGEDADGHRGERRVEYDILSLDVDKETKRTLLCEELAQVLCDAAKQFHRRQKHF